MTGARRGTAFCAFLAAVLPSPLLAESGFEGRLKIGFEAERKTCTNCSSTEHENELEVTVLDLVLSPKAREDLSFGVELEFTTESEGAFFGDGRLNAVNNNALTLWARKDLDDNFWARLQGAVETDERFVELGGRVGYATDLTEKTEISGYLNLDRRIGVGGSSRANEGTYFELGAKFEWELDDFDLWVETEASQWFYDSSSVANERELILQPGIRFPFGESNHAGLLWLERGHEKLTGARQKGEYYYEIGLGAEFALSKRDELFIGLVYGKEREKVPGRPDELADIYRLEFGFQRRF